MAANRLETTGRALCARSQPKSQARTAHLPEAAERLVYTVPEAGRLLGLSRNGAYEAAKRGDIPTIRVGRRLVVPKAAFHQTFGLMRSSDGDKDARF
jgi:excisionase family DNA binding protein